VESGTNIRQKMIRPTLSYTFKKNFQGFLSCLIILILLTNHNNVKGMNKTDDLSRRLLKLYPVDIVKQSFGKKGYQKELIRDVVSSKSTNDILDFAHDSLDYTKQHIYIFSFDKPFKEKGLDRKKIPISLHSEESIIDGVKFNCFSKVEYDVINIEEKSYTEEKLYFLQPISITANEKHLIVQFTKLEKDIGSFFTKSIKAFTKSQKNHETEIIPQLKDYFNAHCKLTVCDLNKGIKAIWDADIVDAKQPSWKDDYSTDTKTMDEDYTFKSKYPVQYKAMLRAPLYKTVFKYIKPDNAFVTRFTIDPLKGFISTSVQSKTNKQISNVITSILSNN